MSGLTPTSTPADLASERVEAERRIRVHNKVAEAYDIVTEAIEEHIVGPKKRLASECVLFSGGNDSTVLAHLFRRDADYFVHINTGIGIEATREFVRDTARLRGTREPALDHQIAVAVAVFLDERHVPQHFKMYQRLKERGLRKVRRRLVVNGRKERVLFIAGRRRQESERRKGIPTSERDGSIVWASPLANWSTQDMADYRKVYPQVPYNPVSQELHMSGECLCGAFAKAGELDEIAFWRPETAVYIRSLEAEVRAAHDAPEQQCQWGWGAYRNVKGRVKNTGPLCQQCVFSYDATNEQTDAPASDPYRPE